MHTVEQNPQRESFPPDSLRRPGERAFWPAALLLLAVYAILSWFARHHHIGVFEDDAVYLLLGRSLGDFGYHDLYQVDTPVHRMYPPGYPAVLATLAAIIGERPVVFQAYGIVAATAALGMLAAVLRQICSPLIALIVLAVLAVNPHMAVYGGSIHSQITYLLFSTTALWLLLRTEPSTRVLVLVSAAAIAAALTRSVGITLLAAIWVHWLLARRFVASALLSVASSATVGVWMLWTVLAPDRYVGKSYIADAGFPGEQAGGSFVSVLLDRTLTNVPTYFGSMIPNRIGIPPLPGPALLQTIAHAGVIVLLTAGAVVLWRLWRPAVLYLVAYVALIILWPWTRADYLTALVPLLVTAILLGAHGIAQRIDPRWGLPALVGMALVLVIFGSARTARIIAQQGNCEWASYLAPGPCQAMGSYFAAARYIVGALPEEAVLLTAEPYRLYYLSGRRSVSYERMLEYTAEEFVDGMREAGVQYILLGRAHTPDYSNLPDLLYANCESLVLEASFHPTTHLFRLAEPVEVGADDTPCRVLRGYAEPLQPLAGG